MAKHGSIVSINISPKKGSTKEAVPQASINKQGIADDAHAGDWHRQISLLALESIKRFEKVLGREIQYGEFAENITTEGLILHEMKPGDRLQIGKDVLLEVTQIGKKCHGDGCAIFTKVGKCVMPKEGIFTTVIQEGEIQQNDQIIHIPQD